MYTIFGWFLLFWVLYINNERNINFNKDLAIYNADIQFTNDTANISEGRSSKNKFADSSLTSVKKFICD